MMYKFSKQRIKVIVMLAVFCLTVLLIAKTANDLCIEMAKARRDACYERATNLIENEACLDQYNDDVAWCNSHSGGGSGGGSE